jgi:hypothetical protein
VLIMRPVSMILLIVASQHNFLPGFNFSSCPCTVAETCHTGSLPPPACLAIISPCIAAVSLA